MSLSSSFILAVIFLTAAIKAIQGQSDGDVKFMDYPDVSPYEGIVQVYRDGQWGGICSYSADIEDATVICRQMKFPMATRAENAAVAFPDHDNEEVTVDRPGCSVFAESLHDCSVTWSDWTPSCSISDVLAIACSPIEEYAIRLMGGTSWYEGRVEVYHAAQDEWGTICNDFWDYRDAKVVCRQLKYGDVDKAREKDGDLYKPGSYELSVLLDNVQCAGTETSLEYCTSNGWYIENCIWNTELAAVFCEPAGETGRLTTGAIVGIVVAVIFCVVLLVSVFVMCYQQSQRKKRGSVRAPAPANSGGGGTVAFTNQGATGGVAFISPSATGQQQQQLPVQYGPPGAQYGPPGAQYGPPGAQYGPPGAQYVPPVAGAPFDAPPVYSPQAYANPEASNGQATG